jgi:hypothetical protein
MLVERNVPSLGIKGMRKWLDKRSEKRVAREGPIPAPTQPLPWDHFRRMPHRLNASRHLSAYVPASIRADSCGGLAFPCDSVTIRLSSAGKDHGLGHASQ